MSLDWSSVKSLAIPEGDVKAVAIGGVTVWQKPSALPYDAEIEYIETTTQGPYASIGTVTTSSTLKMDIDIMANSPSTDEKMFGAIEAVSVGSYSNQWRAWIVNSLYGVGAGTSSTYPRIHVVVSGGAVKFMAGTTTLFNRSVSAGITKPFYAFGIGRANGTVTKGRARIYSISIDGNIVRDLVPVRVGSGSSAVGYLYDRQNPTGGPLGNGLYGNANDGQGGKAGFPNGCLGPDVTT